MYLKKQKLFEMSGAFQILISISICDDVGICLVTKSLNSIKKNTLNYKILHFYLFSVTFGKNQEIFLSISAASLCISLYFSLIINISTEQLKMKKQFSWSKNKMMTKIHRWIHRRRC